MRNYWTNVEIYLHNRNFVCSVFSRRFLCLLLWWVFWRSAFVNAIMQLWNSLIIFFAGCTTESCKLVEIVEKECEQLTDLQQKVETFEPFVTRVFLFEFISLIFRFLYVWLVDTSVKLCLFLFFVTFCKSFNKTLNKLVQCFWTRWSCFRIFFDKIECILLIVNVENFKWYILITTMAKSSSKSSDSFWLRYALSCAAATVRQF